MINKVAFQNRLKTYGLFTSVKQSQIDGMNAIIDEWDKSGDGDNRKLAYVLATTYHETAQRMQPIEEFGKGKGKRYGKKIKYDGTPYTTPDKLYYGRDFCQTTFYDNYEKFGKLLNVDLLNNPELIATLPIASKVIIIGMMKGLFTGVSLKKYFANEADPINARKIINGTDKAQLIAGYYDKFLKCLS